MIITIVSHRNQLGLRINWLHYSEANPLRNLLRGSIGWKKSGEVAELAEGGRLLSDCRGKTSTAGSNPALSALLGWLSLIKAWQIIHEQVRRRNVSSPFFSMKSVSKRWERNTPMFYYFGLQICPCVAKERYTVSFSMSELPNSAHFDYGKFRSEIKISQFMGSLYWSISITWFELWK